MKYVGGGAWIHGVPARDLSSAEQKKYADLIAEQEQLTGIQLYEAAPKRKARKSEQETE